jgi:nitroimidazol reductase NimA-like FMN-containing flavoprotein (pyridoxamine 5'-phosphate oxidase superfamily)
MKRTTKRMAEDAARILRTIPYATLATVDDSGRPWNSPVAAVIAADLAVYWFSDSQAQHSRNVRANGRVFIVVYDSTWPANTGAQGVFMRARAEEVANKLEIAHACALKGGFRAASLRREQCPPRLQSGA